MNTKFNSAVAKTLASSILVSSCTPDASLMQVSEDIEKSTSDALDNTKGVSISLSLSDTAKESLAAWEPIVNEILHDSIAAQSFAKDPSAFCSQRGYNLEIEKEDSVVKALTVLGNPAIRKALAFNDFETYFKLCAELKVFDTQQAVQINSLFKNQKDQEIFETLANELNGNVVSTRSVAAYVVVSVVVVLAIVLTVTVGVEDNDGSTASLHEEGNDSTTLVNLSRYKANAPECIAINLWAINNKVNTYNVINGYKEFFAQSIVSHLKATHSPALEKYSDTQIVEFIKSNMIV